MQISAEWVFTCRKSRTQYSQERAFRRRFWKATELGEGVLDGSGIGASRLDRTERYIWSEGIYWDFKRLEIPTDFGISWNTSSINGAHICSLNNTLRKLSWFSHMSHWSPPLISFSLHIPKSTSCNRCRYKRERSCIVRVHWEVLLFFLFFFQREGFRQVIFQGCTRVHSVCLTGFATGRGCLHPEKASRLAASATTRSACGWLNHTPFRRRERINLNTSTSNSSTSLKCLANI